MAAVATSGIITSSIFSTSGGNDGGGTEPVKPRKNKKSDGPHKRTRTGCMTCRARKIKCDEQKPVCRNCQTRNRDCDWDAVSIFKNDQNPTIETRATKFHRDAQKYSAEDWARLSQFIARQEWIFLVETGDPGDGEQEEQNHALYEPEVALEGPPAAYQQVQVDPELQLQFLASAAIDPALQDAARADEEAAREHENKHEF